MWKSPLHAGGGRALANCTAAWPPLHHLQVHLQALRLLISIFNCQWERFPYLPWIVRHWPLSLSLIFVVQCVPLMSLCCAQRYILTELQQRGLLADGTGVGQPCMFPPPFPLDQMQYTGPAYNPCMPCTPTRPGYRSC